MIRSDYCTAQYYGFSVNTEGMTFAFNIIYSILYPNWYITLKSGYREKLGKVNTPSGEQMFEPKYLKHAKERENSKEE